MQRSHAQWNQTWTQPGSAGAKCLRIASLIHMSEEYGLSLEDSVDEANHCLQECGARDLNNKISKHLSNMHFAIEMRNSSESLLRVCERNFKTKVRREPLL
jgi:hypothetical protein